MAESDASSEMSDDALQKLVSRLVEVGEDLGGEEVDKTRHILQESPGHATSESESAQDTGDEEQCEVAADQASWPTAPFCQSPVQPPRGRSPCLDGLGRGAAFLASLDAIDCSSQGQAGTSLVISNSSVSESDNYGRKDDVGGRKNNITASAREPAILDPPGSSAKTVRAEDSKVSGKESTESQEDQQAVSLDVTGEGSHSVNGRPCSRLMPKKDGRSPWDTLNESLREQGFCEVSLERPGGSITVPDPASLADTLREVVFKHGERGKLIQDMSLELQRLNNVGEHRESVLNESFRREKSDLSRRSTQAEARVAALEEDAERLREQLAKETRRWKAENASLALQLKQSEHRVKAKEAAAQKLIDKLQVEAEKDYLSQQREQGMFMKRNQKEAFGGSTHDSRMKEFLHAHTRAYERSKIEMDELRAEISRLGDELREKENTILKHRLGPDWTPDLDQNTKATLSSDENRELRARLSESERRLRIMTQREAKALERCATMEREGAEVQATIEKTQKSLVNVQLELASRPSMRNWRASQRRIQDLETKLSQVTTQAREAVGVAELRRWVDTKELMRRDRGNHRLKLDRLEDLPSAVLKQVVQDSCRLLALQDVSLLSSSVSKLIKAVQMLPRLERFVNSVCSFVFRHSAGVMSSVPNDRVTSQATAVRERTMENVLPILEVWLSRAQAPNELKDFQQSVLRVLETRRGTPKEAPRGSLSKSDQAVIATIEHLVEFERRSLREAHMNEQADWSVHDDPSPVNRVVQHFQLLFGVNSVGGCLPKLNEVYRFSNETQTFLRTCGDLLNMPEATADTIMREIKTSLEDRVDADADTCLHASHSAESWAGCR